MKRIAAGLWVCLLTGIACDSAKPNPDAGSYSAPLVAAPMPARLVAEFALRNPKETWAAFRSGIGGTVSLLADSPAQVLANLAAIEPQLSAELLQDAPIAGVISVTEGHDPVVVVALPFANPAKVLADAGVSTGGDLVFLPPKAGGTCAAIAKRGYLLIGMGAGSGDEELKRLSPYLLTKVAASARVPANPSGPMSKRRTEGGLWVTGREALTVEAKRNIELSISNATLTLEAANKRQREAKGGRAPDFGDAEPLIAKLVESKDALVKIVDQITQVNAFVGVRDGELVADVELEPRAGGEFDAILKSSKTCAADAIGEEPQQSVAAYFVCESESDRKKSAEAQVGLIANVLGNRGAEEKKLLEVFAKAWPDARGDELTVSLSLAGDDGAPSFRVLSPLGHAEAADAARGALRTLLGRPLVADALHAKLSGEKKVEAGTYALSLKRKTSPKEVAIVWSTDRNQLLIAGAQHIDAAKVAALRVAKTKLIGASTLSRELKVLGKDALAALVLQPLLLTVTKQQLAPQIAMVSFSRDVASGHAVVRLVMQAALARELIKLRMPVE